jgi:hypothetical protein
LSALPLDKNVKIDLQIGNSKEYLNNLSNWKFEAVVLDDTAFKKICNETDKDKICKVFIKIKNKEK